MTARTPQVLVTRSRTQASELGERLRALGTEPILVPTIEIVEPTSFAPLDAALASLDHFEWLLFTSANAVEVFGRRLALSPGVSVRAKVAAIGRATAAALAELGLVPDLVPKDAVAESLTEALLPHARQADGRATRFLLIRAEQAREHLPEALRAAGGEVTIAPAYRTVIPDGSLALVRELFRPVLAGAAGSAWNMRARSAGEGPKLIEAITFTSSSSVRNLLALCEAAGVTLPEGALRVSIGPVTSQTLREVGLPPHAEAREATAASLAATVVDALSSNNKR